MVTLGNVKSWIFVFLALPFASATPGVAVDGFGRFVGELVVKFAPDGRNVILDEPFAYVDQRGIEWTVPIGTETDGASVPPIFWAMYPPFTGSYRLAAVIHDRYCRTEERTWEETHEVFYNAMRAADVGEKTAKLLYSAVYYYGPRWGPGISPLQRKAAHTASLEQQEQFVKAMEAFVEKENPSLDRLVAHANQEGKRLLRHPGGGQ